MFRLDDEVSGDEDRSAWLANWMVKTEENDE
jgi:hypothetical protein